MQTLRTSTSSTTTETETLRSRIASLEAANRETVAVLEGKTTVNEKLAQDVQKQHQKGLELSQQITTLQQAAQNATSAASSAKFRMQTIQQELELARKNNEWLDNELKTKSAEALKFRKEKGTRISELQRLNEEANSNLDALKRTEQLLRTRLEEVQKKAEDSLLKVQQLQEAAAKTEEGFRQELESARRLAELQAQQTETHRNRLQEVEASLDKIKDEASEEIGHARQEAEAERQEREAVAGRVIELEAEVGRLEALAEQTYPASMPGTPRMNGSVFGRSGSPATPGAARKGAMTATQALGELYRVKAELKAERRRSEKLSAEMDDMMQGLEAKQPELDEMSAEHDRLQEEVVEMSRFVDQTGKERDQAKKDARKSQSEAAIAQKEGDILRQQLRDLSAQIKMLLFEMQSREQGLESMGMAERTQFEALARGEVDEDSLDGMTDTDKFISKRLVIYRDVSACQKTNEDLLRLTRELSQQMESDEAVAAKNEAAKDHEEVIKLQKKVESYKDELHSMVTRSESYIKERDMFRRMLQHRGHLPANSDLQSVFGQSVQSHDGQNGLRSSIEGNNDKATADALRELQKQFDEYRSETSVDRRTIKEQSEKLASEKGALQSEIAKISSQLTLASERYEMLQNNYTMLQTENKELQKRSQVLSESAAKQDLKTQQVAEDLIEAKGLLDNMRNENSNLKAEKNLWKDVQERLSQDNQSLMEERSRLNNLMTTQQSLHNERETADSETRRRLQSQIETLETELNATKRKLNDETEDSKKAQLRKEYDMQQHQKRVDDLMASLSSIREELVGAKTSRDHLQARVDELVIQLKNAEERVEVLQPRPTPRIGTNGNSHGQENALSREQELAIEAADLKRDLELAKSELEAMKQETEQYQAIAQAAEEQLQSLNETQDQYREEMDRVLAEKDAKIRDLEQRIEDTSSELSTTNTELTTLRNQQGEVARRAEEEKAVLDAEIIRLRDADERHVTAAQFHQQDLRAQAEIATKAQQDYERELSKHADSAKHLQALRTEFNQVKTEALTYKTEAESARVTLSQSQTSWEERRMQFESELAELRTRRDDIAAQNKLLHQQLESVSTQISALQHSRATFVDEGENTGGASDRSVDDLRELVKYLRREKEIVDVQYDLSVQEAKRLKQQLDYAQSQLDESRLKLEQERKSHADGGKSNMDHKDLMKKLEELNLFRESSITLRNEARTAQAQLADKSRRVEELLEQIQPLETKVRELENSKDTQEGEMRLLQEDRDRWQKRTQDILSKYDRIDPAEMEQLKASIAALETERDSLVTGQEPMQGKIATLEQENAQLIERRQKIIEQSKERDRAQKKLTSDRAGERDTAIQERDAVQLQLDSIKQELEIAVQEKQALEQQLQDVKQELEALKSTHDQVAASTSQAATDATSTATDQHLADVQKELTSTTQAKQSLETQLVAVQKELDACKSVQPNQDAEEQLATLRQELEDVRAARDEAIASVTEAQAARSSDSVADKPADKTADSAMENGIEDGQIDENPTSSVSGAERAAFEERIAAGTTKIAELEAKVADLESNIDARVKANSDRMMIKVNKKLQELRTSQKAELDTEYTTKKTQLERDYDTRLAQEKVIWQAENASSIPAAPTTIPGTPAPAPTTEAQTPVATFTSEAFMALPVQDVQLIIRNNPHVKAIISENIKKKVSIDTKALVEETQKKREDLEAAIAEAEKRIEDAKTQATHLAEKKASLKLNMAENRTKTANAKLEVVEKAAKEEPTKPVGEVWEVAKVARPSIVAPAVR